MDTITHTLFGLTTFGAVNKAEMSPKLKTALLAAAVAGSQIPDIDFVVQFTQKGSMMYQMWHRGLTHSLFLTPLWALLIYGLCFLFWGQRDPRIFYLGLVNAGLHIGFDSLNAWGTGLFEPLTSARVSLGIIPIVDFVILGFILTGFLVNRIGKMPRHRVWIGVWLAILLHVAVQGGQGFIIHQQAKTMYQETALSAGFIPGQFTVVGKTGERVEIYKRTVWKGRELVAVIASADDANLEPLFADNPRAEVLMQWSPFVVVVEDGGRLGIFDPRFYQNGTSFLSEYINLD